MADEGETVKGVGKYKYSRERETEWNFRRELCDHKIMASHSHPSIHESDRVAGQCQGGAFYLNTHSEEEPPSKSRPRDGLENLFW